MSCMCHLHGETNPRVSGGGGGGGDVERKRCRPRYGMASKHLRGVKLAGLAVRCSAICSQI